MSADLKVMSLSSHLVYGPKLWGQLDNKNKLSSTSDNLAKQIGSKTESEYKTSKQTIGKTETELRDYGTSSTQSEKRISISIDSAPKLPVENDNVASEFAEAYRGAVRRHSLRTSLVPGNSDLPRSSKASQYIKRKSVTYEEKLIKLEQRNEARRKLSNVSYTERPLKDANLRSRSLGYQHEESTKMPSTLVESPEHQILRQSLRSSLMPDDSNTLKIGRNNERKSLISEAKPIMFEPNNEERRESSRALNLPPRKSLEYQGDISYVNTVLKSTEDLLLEEQIVQILRQSLRKSLTSETGDGSRDSKVGQYNEENGVGQSQSSVSTSESKGDAFTTNRKLSSGVNNGEVGTHGRSSIAEKGNIAKVEEFGGISSQTGQTSRDSAENTDKEVGFKAETDLILFGPRVEVEEMVLLHGTLRKSSSGVSPQTEKSAEENDSLSDETEDSGISSSDNSDTYGGRCDFTYKYKGGNDIHSLRTSFGSLKWLSTSSREYCGYFQYNNLHGQGYYFIKKEGCMNFYDGKFYNNKLHGYGQIIYDNGDKFEGLFRENFRFGPGVLTHGDGTQDVGIWHGNSLIKLSTCSSDIIPLLGKSNAAKLKLLEYKKKIPVTPSNENIAESILKDLGADESTRERFKELYNPHVRNSHSVFFDKSQYDFSYYGAEDCNIDVVDNNAALLDFVWSKQEMSDWRNITGVEHTKKVERALKQLKEKVENLITQCEKNSEVEVVGEDMPNLKVYSSPCDVLFFKKVLQFLEFKLNKSEKEQKYIRDTRKIVVDSILAWNNDDTLVEVLRHSFLCRKSEENVNFNVKNVIIGNRSHFNPPGIHEKNSSNFLEKCASSDVIRAHQLLANENLSPNLRDSRGNTGLHLATWKNDTNTIQMLANHGCNLNCVNDEGVTPLSLCLLQHLQYVYDVTSWDVSFLDLEGLAKDEERLRKLKPNETMLNMLQVNTSEMTILSHTSTKFSRKRISTKQKASCSTLTGSSKATFLPRRFIFSLEYSSSSRKLETVPEKDEISVAGSLKEDLEETGSSPQERRTLATLQTLLRYGADPNKDAVPYPPLFLALFSKSPEIVHSFLSGKVDPNMKIQGMTPIQVVSCLEPSEKNCEIMRMLLDTKADPNISSDLGVWKECDKHLLGNYEPDFEVQNCGKNALHLICLREDFTSSNNYLLCNMAEMLIFADVDTQSLYFGHSCLSMAVTKGNVGLVELLVRFVDARRPLGFGLGNALTILALSRYQNILPFFVCQKMIDILLTKVSPLDPLYHHFNIFEFIDLDSPSTSQNDPKEWDKYANNIKSIQAFLKTDPSKETEKSAEELSRVYLQEQSRKFLDVINKFKAVYYLYCFFENGSANKYTNHLAKFVRNSDEALIYLRYIFSGGKMSPSHFSLQLIAELMNYVDGVNKTKKKTEIKQEESASNDKTKLNSVDFVIKASRKTRNDEISLALTKKSQRDGKATLREYNLDDYLEELDVSKFTNREDPDFEHIARWANEANLKKCNVCYFCMQRKDKILLKCPNCGIVKFCSKRCNYLSRKLNDCHRCPGVYYQEIRKKYKEFIDKNLPVPVYGIDLEFNTLRDKGLQTETPVIPSEKGNIITLDVYTGNNLKIRLRSGDDTMNKERFSSPASKCSGHQTKKQYICETGMKENQYSDTKKQRVSKKRTINKIVPIISSRMILDPEVLNSSKMMNRENTVQIENRKSSEIIMFPPIHNKIHMKWKSPEQDAQSKNKRNLLFGRALKDNVDSLNNADKKFIIQAYRYFFRELSDLNVESLFLPFTCCSKEKLFHRLPDHSDTFCQFFFS